MSNSKLFTQIVQYYRKEFTQLYRLPTYSQQAVLARLDRETMEDLEIIQERSTMTYVLLSEALAAAQGANLGDELYEALQAGLMRRLLSFRAIQQEFPGLSRPSELDALEPPFKAYRKKLLRLLDHWNDGELYHFALQDFVDRILPEVRRRHKKSYELVRARCGLFKEELIAAAWHPTRVAKWVNAGLDVEEL
jgi:hypothetical protein